MKTETDWIAGLIFDGAPAMDELLRVDLELADPMQKFLERRGAELYLSKPASGAEPDWNDVIGVVAPDDDNIYDDSYRLEKHFEKRSSSPYKIRLERVIEDDGVTMVYGYDHLGCHVFTGPYRPNDE